MGAGGNVQMNICRYITSVENMYLTHVTMRNFELFDHLLAGGILRMDVSRWTVELVCLTDTKKRSTSEVYVVLNPSPDFSYTFALYHTSRPNKMEMEVELK